MRHFMFLLNEHLLPEGVTKSDLKYADDWIMKSLQHFSYPFPEVDVVIELSSLTPKRRFGDLSLAKAKTIILGELKKLIIADEENSESLNRLREAKDADVAKSVIEEIFRHYFDPADGDALWPKMRDYLSLLDKVYFKRLVLGEYAYATHWVSQKEKTIDDQRIILYVNNIKNCLKEGKTIGDGMKEVMAHEYFHMCHHYAGYIKNNYEFDEREDYLSQVVTETLATLFQRCPFDGSHLEREWEGNVLINPYAGCRYLHSFMVQKREKNMENDDDFFTLKECLEIGMNKWLKMILNDPCLYYQILNKGVALPKKQTPFCKKKGLKLKEGTVYKASSLDDLLRNRLGLNAHGYRDAMLIELDNGELVLSIDERDLAKYGEFELLDGGSILCRRVLHYAYFRTIHVFLSNLDGSKNLFEYEGSFELRCGDAGKRILVRKKGERRIHPFRIRLKENLLAALRDDEEDAFDPKSSFSFLIDNYKFPEVDVDDNFLKCLEGILKEKGISKYKMYELSGLDRDNNKQYFDKSKYERKKGMNPNSDVPFVVPAKVAYKICLGLKLSPSDAEHLISLAKQPNTKSGNITRFVLECLKDKELLELGNAKYKQTINRYLKRAGKDILYEW